MRILFLGNHTVGVRTLETLLDRAHVCGVVAHPPDPEDGIDYLSLFDFAQVQGLNVVRMAGREAGLIDFARQCRPDLIWITDYRYLLPGVVTSMARLGAVNLHPSLLPKYRGRAPINWAILNGESELGLTAHFVDEGMDTGDIIEQERFLLTEEQDVGDALRALYPLYASITRKVLRHFESGQVPRRIQDHDHATVFPRRRPEDGRIAWQLPAGRIRDLVRAVAKPYPGAFSFCRGKKIMIWAAALYPSESTAASPGRVLFTEKNAFVVVTGKGNLLIRSATYESTARPFLPQAGDILGAE